jgi:hypothetical protein
MKTQDSMMTKDTSSIPAPAERLPFSPRPFAEPAASEVTTAAPVATHHSLRNISFAVQPKLTIGQPNDKYEQEADRVAEEVIQRINAPQFSAMGFNNPDPNIAGNGKPKLQLKPIFQRRSTIEGDATPDLESSINRARCGGQSLDSGLQAKMGWAMGADFSRVKVHTDAQSDRLSRSIQAKAFTTGQDVFFRQGAYEPNSRGGQELIAHELTHVVQQNGGAVQRTQGYLKQLQQKPLDIETSKDSQALAQRKFSGDLQEVGKKFEHFQALLRKHTVEQYKLNFSEFKQLQSSTTTDYATIESVVERLGKTYVAATEPKQEVVPSIQEVVPSIQEVVPSRQEEVAPSRQEEVQHTPGLHNVVKNGSDDVHVLIPKTLTICDLFRGDSRSRVTLARDGFKPGEKPRGYVEKLKAFLKTRNKGQAESDARHMISREAGQNIDSSSRIVTDLTQSLTRISLDDGKKITLLNYVCAGAETGAGTTSYLIKVDEAFECISASPNIGLYQSRSGMQIVAVAQSGASNTGYVKFTEYDFLTSIPGDRIYYSSNDNGNTQTEGASSWFRLTDGTPR